MRKIILLILFFIIIVFNFNKEDYNFRISLKFRDLTSEEINSKIAQNIENIILNDSLVKDYTVISSFEYCNIYLKTPNINKTEILEEIKSSVQNFNYEIFYDFNYDKKYDYFLILTSDNDDYYNLKNKLDFLENILIKNKLINKILQYPKIEKITYIFLDIKKQQEYNLSIENIIKLIKSNNLKENASYKNSLLINTNSKITNSDDIKNISFKLKSKYFQEKTGDIFQIKEDVRQNGEIFFNNKNSLILAIDLKNIFYIKLKQIINNINTSQYEYNINIFNLKNKKIITLYFDEKLSYEDIYKKYIEISNLLNKHKITSCLYFIGLEVPKINKNTIFLENNENKITIIFSVKDYFKIKKLLKNYNSNNPKRLYFNTFKELSQNDILSKDTVFEKSILINNYDITDFYFTKEEVLNSIKLDEDGVFADYFYQNQDKNEIYLKNKAKTDFIYNKFSKKLIPKKELYKIEIKKSFKKIYKKNGRYFTILRQ